MTQQKAIRSILSAGALLVFPITNRKEPRSLWHELHPRRKMNWDWSESSDDAVPDLWHLMKRLSSCRKVIYSKWYQGRATFFAPELFQALLSASLKKAKPLSQDARRILKTLEEDSPLSTKELKLRTELQGRLNEAAYTRACKELYQNFLIVAFGEVDDGAFPSLALGATRHLYEDLWNQAQELKATESERILNHHLKTGSAFRKFYDRTQSSSQRISI